MMSFFAIFKLLAIVIANDISERSFLYAAFHPDKVEEALIAVRLLRHFISRQQAYEYRTLTRQALIILSLA